MTDYLPEGRLIQRAENKLWVESIDSLAEAMHQKTVIEAVAERCDSEKNLHVRLGHWQGVIPRDETALGLREGTLREIAVLARVGKPVGFQVIGLEANDGRLTPLLSRRTAQRSALNHLRSLPRGAILNATVTRLESFGAFVDIGCGRAAPRRRPAVPCWASPGWRRSCPPARDPAPPEWPSFPDR